ncbi:hypothetical protein U0L90_03130 [Flavobacteriaceae sp. LMIT009]
MAKLLLKTVFLSFLALISIKLLGNLFTEERRGDIVWNNFYELQEDNLDVIFLGNSLSYSSFNPLIFNSYSEINSYNLGFASQNIKQAYHVLKEALAYQSPQVVVLEAYTLDIIDNSEEDRLGFKFENLNSQRVSLRKLVSINDQFSSLQNKVNAAFPLVRNHDNWREIHKIRQTPQTKPKEDRFLGFKATDRNLDKKKLSEALKRLPKTHSFSEENKYYFERTVELCKRNGIRLVVVRAPVLLSKYNAEYYKDVNLNTKELCSDFKIRYIDYNIKFHELGLSEGSYFDGLHLNYRGATKISEILSKELDFNHSKKKTKNPTAPEDFIYSSKYDNLAQTIFKGGFNIDNNTIVKEVKLVRLRENEISVIVKLDKSLKTNDIAKYNVGYYFYPVDSEETLLETEKDLKRKYTSSGGPSVPMQFNDNYYVTLRSHKTKVKKFKKIKIQLYNKEGVYGESLLINNILFK